MKKQELDANNLRWHVEAAIERIMELPEENRCEGTLLYDALSFLHEGLIGKNKGLSSSFFMCPICGCTNEEKHR